MLPFTLFSKLNTFWFLQDNIMKFNEVMENPYNHIKVSDEVFILLILILKAQKQILASSEAIF